MAKALSKSQLVTAIAEKAQLSKKQAAEILDHLAALAYKHAKDTFTLPASSSSKTAPPAWAATRRPGKPSRSKPSAS